MNFKFDEKVSIKSILKALKTEGIKTADVAKQIDGISEKPLRLALKTAGYNFSNKVPKGWHYIGEGPEPLESSIFEYVKRSNTKVNNIPQTVISSNIDMKDDNTNVNNSNTPMNNHNIKALPNSPVLHPQFTHAEIADLIEMLQEWRIQKKTEHLDFQEEPTPVHERIKKLPENEKTRKTIVIDKNIGEHLDQYCKNEKVNKSDILHLALIDFLNKYKS